MASLSKIQCVVLGLQIFAKYEDAYTKGEDDRILAMPFDVGDVDAAQLRLLGWIECDDEEWWATYT